MAQEAQWCNLEEAARQTRVNVSEVKSLAYQGALFTAIYSPKRRYLVFTRAEGGNIIGHATCDYFGPLAVPDNITNTLLGGQSANLNGIGGKPMDARGLTNWNGSCPFRSEQSGNLAGWASLAAPESFRSPFLMTPMPREHAGRVLIEKIRKSRPSDLEANELTAAIDQLADKFLPNDYNLDYRDNGKFGPEALIFYALCESREAESEDEASGVEQSAQFAPPGERADDMSWLLWRVRNDHPRLTAKAIWNLLREEVDSAVPKYDIDCILRDISGDTIYWCTTKGQERTLSGRGFENRLSRIKARSPVDAGE